jgi:DNA-binding NarL/FixJ family response regulator
MQNQIRILIADDHPMFREGVVQSLSGDKDFAIIGQASNGKDAFEMAKELLPDVLLLDITMPDQDGITIAKKISAAFPVIQIIMLTASENEDDLMKALKAGARGYVLKGISAKELIKVIRTIAAGGTYISPDMANMILFELSQPSQPDPLSELSDREKEILNLVAKGYTNREIGAQVHLSEKTIKHYMTNILQKLHVRSRVEAALLVQKRDIERK